MSSEDDLIQMLEYRVCDLELRVGEILFEMNKPASFTVDGRVVCNANRVDALEVVYQKAHAVTRTWKNGASISHLFDKLQALSEALQEVV